MPAPDVNTNAQIMAWIMDTYSMHQRQTVTAVVTGKPEALGGSRGRPEATGRGCMIVTLQALKRLGLAPESSRVVIQGFGNVGGMAAKLMKAIGFKIVCIVEYDGAVYNPNGLDIAALQKHRKETGSITGFSGGEEMDKAEAMFLPCDVLIPAATENVVTSANADRLRCKILCEGANGPTTPLADEILGEKGVFVIPDILANAGGVTVSYFEWVQDRQGFFWTEKAGQRTAGADHGGELRRHRGVCRKAPRPQPHRRLHGGTRSRGRCHQPPGNLRVSEGRSRSHG